MLLDSAVLEVLSGLFFSATTVFLASNELIFSLTFDDGEDDFSSIFDTFTSLVLDRGDSTASFCGCFLFIKCDISLGFFDSLELVGDFLPESVCFRLIKCDISLGFNLSVAAEFDDDDPAPSRPLFLHTLTDDDDAPPSTSTDPNGFVPNKFDNSFLTSSIDLEKNTKKYIVCVRESI